jgi:hypothetical protein
MARHPFMELSSVPTLLQMLMQFSLLDTDVAANQDDAADAVAAAADADVVDAAADAVLELCRRFAVETIWLFVAR